MARLSLKKVGEYLRPHTKPLVLGIVALLIVNGLSVAIREVIRSVVALLEKMVGGVEIADPIPSLLWSAAGVVTLACVMWVIRMASRMWIFGVGRSIEYELRQKIFNHLLTLPPSYFSQQSVGEIISIVTSDVENIRRLLGFALLSLTNTVFAYGLTLPAMIAIDLRLTLLALAPYPFMMLLVQAFGDKMRAEQQTVQEKLSDVSSLLQEDLNSMALIKTYAQEENERRAFRQKNLDLLEANLQMARTRNILFPALGGIVGVSLLLIVWQGGLMIIDGKFNLSGLITLILYVEYLTFPTALLGFTLTVIQRGQVSIDRVEGLLSVPPAIVDPADAITVNLAAVAGKIEVRHLSFTYLGAKTPTLVDVSFTVAPGERLAIIGAIGSGKSTLANLIPRLLPVPPGTIFIDDIDITKMRVRDLRTIVTYVPQESFLFSLPILENIRYGKPDASFAQVEYYAEQAHIQGEILSFPQKYETLVGERGITLSGGQRQRTALARALLMDAPILLLDDALASVDNQTAAKILANLPRHKTIIFITHKLSAAMNCDRILILDRGCVHAIGTHQELMAASPLYRKLWQQYQLEQAVS
ncbi:MAG: ABC transporter ATP-binding protein [Pseudanabaenaceae cyanobacterium SKYGB_i_bin29]|nr:ABC transporter ATP-binding protein/permease [Pseudanabaenaceae cyanobacterium SKYG29]MDW8421484.1 ABC transporter ATP-binding protein [Pseudanabaenaceae cyanobacterium SKYGB_i_bin29]